MDNYIKYIGLFIFNIAFTLVLGLLTLDSFATIYSRGAGVLIALLIPLLLYYRRPQKSAKQRVAEYGVGIIIYIILILKNVNLDDALRTCVLPVTVLSVIGLVLFSKDFFYKSNIAAVEVDELELDDLEDEKSIQARGYLNEDLV